MKALQTPAFLHFLTGLPLLTKQAPFLHALPLAQTLRQTPQCWTSVWRSTQVPAHLVRPSLRQLTMSPFSNVSRERGRGGGQREKGCRVERVSLTGEARGGQDGDEDDLALHIGMVLQSCLPTGQDRYESSRWNGLWSQLRARRSSMRFHGRGASGLTISTRACGALLDAKAHHTTPCLTFQTQQRSMCQRHNATAQCRARKQIPSCT